MSDSVAIELNSAVNIAGVVYYVRGLRYDGEYATIDLICPMPGRGVVGGSA